MAYRWLAGEDPYAALVVSDYSGKAKEHNSKVSLHENTLQCPRFHSKHARDLGKLYSTCGEVTITPSNVADQQKTSHTCDCLMQYMHINSWSKTPIKTLLKDQLHIKGNSHQKISVAHMIELLLKSFVVHRLPIFEAWKVPKRPVEVSCDITLQFAA